LGRVSVRPAWACPEMRSAPTRHMIRKDLTQRRRDAEKETSGERILNKIEALSFLKK